MAAEITMSTKWVIHDKDGQYWGDGSLGDVEPVQQIESLNLSTPNLAPFHTTRVTTIVITEKN